MESNSCENCPWRAKFDKNPKSFLGKIWRWHINFCPGWKKYLSTMDEDNRAMIIEKYHIQIK